MARPKFEKTPITVSAADRQAVAAVNRGKRKPVVPPALLTDQAYYLSPRDLKQAIDALVAYYESQPDRAAIQSSELVPCLRHALKFAQSKLQKV